MTTRLYYDDAYTTRFSARLVGQLEYGGQPALVLERTYFYPTSGGQPHDTGTIDGARVVDVVVREADGEVLHVVDELPDLGGSEVEAIVDWDRRFDHMQHHTGQHILSQAFVEVAQAETVGFHLSDNSVTVDLNRATIAPHQVQAAEELANRIVTENRPVRSWFPGGEERAELRLRKVPDVDGQLRVVEIQDFDVNACGGTHVANTGEIGVIKVLRAERRGDTVRVEFRCGGRALHDYRAKHGLLQRLAADMTSSYEELPALLHKLREENKALGRELRGLRESLLAHEAVALRQQGLQRNGMTLVSAAFERREVSDLRHLAQRVTLQPATLALLGLAGEKAHLVAARSEDLNQDMPELLRRGLAVWGIERGGGRPAFAEGGGPAASPGQVQAALNAMLEAVTRSDPSR